MHHSSGLTSRGYDGQQFTVYFWLKVGFGGQLLFLIIRAVSFSNMMFFKDTGTQCVLQSAGSMGYP